MTEAKAWPGIYRSKFTGRVVLFTDRNAGYLLIPSGPHDRAGDLIHTLEDCGSAAHWGRVTLRAEPAKNVKPDAPKWPAAYRSRATGRVVFFTSAEVGYCVAPRSAVTSSRYWLVCDDPKWERVDLFVDDAWANRAFAEAMTRVAEAERDSEKPAAPAEPAPMNLLQALVWLDAHRGAELEVVLRCPAHVAFRVRNFAGRFEYENGSRWHLWTPDLSRAAEYSATIPKRKLPTPPAGYEWRETEQGLRLAQIGTSVYYPTLGNEEALAVAKELNAARACLITEYETRPK